ncbi:phage protein NinX family protein [Paraburkholderia sp. EG287A]|uniref:phage protein NinX family protein n=1 Tax=Paraburkholderia sp. EG287A TaxID=3237012 RepID=UPI0034D1BE7D
MKTGELTNEVLDFWVAKAMEVDARMSDIYPNGTRHMVTYYSRDEETGFLDGRSFCPSSHVSDGGALVISEHINMAFQHGQWWSDIASRNEKYPGRFGYTHVDYLVAAMRALVASRFGPEVPDNVIPPARHSRARS